MIDKIDKEELLGIWVSLPGGHIDHRLDLLPDNTGVYWTSSFTYTIKYVFSWKISDPDNMFCIEAIWNMPFDPVHLLAARKWKIGFIKTGKGSVFPWEVLVFSTWFEKGDSIEYEGGVIEFPAQEVTRKFRRADEQLGVWEEHEDDGGSHEKGERGQT
jgi:hypothetical protein